MRHLQGLWFAPGNFAQQLRVGHILPAYQPYHLVDAEAATLYKFEGGDLPEVLSRRLYGVLLPAADPSFLPEFQAVIGQVADWAPLRAVLPDSPVAAHNVLLPDAVPFEQAWEPWYRRVEQEQHAAAAQLLARKTAAATRAADTIHVVRPMVITTELQSRSSSLVLLPLYISKYLYQSKEHVVVVNAQTGSVVLERVYGFGTLGKIGSWLTS